ncbi:MAG: response regulator [Caulobacteraceae bacterium]
MSSRPPIREGMPPEHLAAMSHEFRTPLNGVLGMARLLEGTALTEEQQAYVQALIQSGEHLLGLVNDVLDYAKLGADRAMLHVAPVDIEETVRSVAELLSPRAHEKNIEIGWSAPADLAPVLADETRLKQILLNLAGNAIKFTERGGVLITAEKTGVRRIRLTVSDTGPGVPLDARERIFEAFAHADPEHGARMGGAGLGLAIARRLAQAMGGEVGVGGSPGSGADFWFEASFPEAAPSHGIQDLSGRTVGVASPSAIVREAARGQIEASGGKAVSAGTLEDLISRAPASAVLLVDHALAGEGRVSLPEDRAAIILVRPEERGHVSAYREAGAAGYLIKPLRRASLAARVLAAESGDAPAETGHDERISPKAAPAPVRPGARVLLAEDNPINAMLARTLLVREGCTVEHVTGGEAALEALIAQPFDLVLMDVRMPGMSGLDATRALRARGVTTPVVALTANAFEDDRRICLAAGMDDFLVKPLSADALRAALSRWTGPGWTDSVKRANLAG